MSLRKLLNVMFMLLLIAAVGCGQGKEVVDEAELGEDDQALPTASETAGGEGTAAATPATTVVANAATVGGSVKFEGTPPRMSPVQMAADPFCATAHAAPVAAEDAVIGPAGELANVIVYVKNAPATPTPTTAALLDQVGCQYIPHVSAVQVNQPIQIRNSDNTLHNVHAMPKTNAQFNEGQPVQGMVSNKKFDKVEPTPFLIKCDVHGWMKSYMAVLPHSYHSVSQANGGFSIANLPPGNYTLVAWHEKFGEQEQQVTVAANEQKQITFTFKG